MVGKLEKVVKQEDFDAALEEILDGMSGAELLAIPGVYEVVSEELNNEALERARENAEARAAEEKAARTKKTSGRRR